MIALKNIQEIPVYFHDEEFGFAAKADAVPIRPADLRKEPPDEALPDMPGFEVFIFNRRDRWAGFRDSLKLLRERDDDICYAWAEISARGFGVIVWSKEWEMKPEKWEDLRGGKEWAR